MNDRRRYDHLSRIILSVVAVGACLGPGAPATLADSTFESYEADFGAWTPNADTPLSWSVTRTQEQAFDGVWSLDFTADGRADDGTVWVYRRFLLPAGTYDLSVDFQMWSPSEGLFGAWRVVAFIGTFEPQFEEDFTDIGATNQATGWFPYGHSETITVNQPTHVYVAYGFNIVFEVIRTYFFDAVTVTGLPPLCDDPSCNNDGTCDAGEDCFNCSCDCVAGDGAACGNGLCEAGNGEDCVSCPSDCNGKQSGKPSGRFCCGDGDGSNPVSCSDSRCTQGGFDCTDVPTASSCCGDGVCEGAEDSCLCAVDCGAPPLDETSCDNGADDDCDGAVDCADIDCSAFAGCNCVGPGRPCAADADCCSGNCKGNGSCK